MKTSKAQLKAVKNYKARDTAKEIVSTKVRVPSGKVEEIREIARKMRESVDS